MKSSLIILNDWVYDKDAKISGVLLLEADKSDPSKCVQNSVGQGLKDASKANPDWVRQFCGDRNPYFLKSRFVFCMHLCYPYVLRCEKTFPLSTR
ncbi:hypothetical protein OB236_10065 [Paenibacillus sp. WQ 127069]|uniref:Uncharacterized protein n=1 Tax=Paenibacillus baimaensis TaxID=2982185 RepID=A0ABT2UCV6_9BACL|nr:hypothetical protein [Paenibacillus sp. WQ 127069]